jgi:beta-glucanase (GH16 family)
MEFDIMEALAAWGPWRHDIGMHWDDYQHDHKSIGDFSCYYVPDAEGFDTVGMLWTPGEIIMYDNGKESVRWDSPRVGSVESYILLNYITGGWESDPIDDRELPSDFVVDYVRVWQRKDLASPKDGPKKNEDGLYPPKG